MKTLLAIILLSSVTCFATGMKMTSVCTPVLTDEGNPSIEFVTLSTSAPGGPVHSESTISIDGSSPVRKIKNSLYENGAKVEINNLVSPTGSVYSKLLFINIEPGKSDFPEMFEVLYKCETKH